MPAFDAEAPLFYYLIPEHERAARCELSSDVCVVDGKYFFVRGCIEIPVHGADEPFVWGVWVSLSEASFSQYLDSYDEPRRAHLGPFFGWLSASFKVYPETEGSLKTRPRSSAGDDGVRPYIELEHLSAWLRPSQTAQSRRSRSESPVLGCANTSSAPWFSASQVMISANSAGGKAIW